MAKRVAKTTNGMNASGAAPKRASVSKAKKHIQAQAAGVAAAVEGFVQAIAHTGESTELLEAPVVETAVVETPVEKPSVTAATTMEATVDEVPESLAKEFEGAAAPVAPSHEEVAKLAYEYYLQRGGQNGSQADDWFRAESALTAKASA